MQMREKQALEVNNAQLASDLENLRNQTNREINRLNEALEQANGKLNSCTQSSQTLQSQLISIRSESNDNKAL